MYLSQEYEYKLQPDLNRMENFIETVFVEVIVPNNKNILIGTICRPPNSSQDDFSRVFHELLLHPLMLNKTCFLLGDYNINLLNNATDTFVQNFVDTLLTASFLRTYN